MDEFIEYLWIWLLFNEFIDDCFEKGGLSISSIHKWCEERNIIYEGLMKVTEERDNFIENLLLQNIDVFYNGLNLKRGTYNLLEIIRKDINAGMDEIKKIKYCIFEGYKLNIATYNNKTKTYEMDFKNVPLKIIETSLINPLPMVEEIQQSVPKKIIVSSVNVISN